MDPETQKTTEFVNDFIYEFRQKLNIVDKEEEKDILDALKKTLPKINWAKLIERQCMAQIQGGKNAGKQCTAQTYPGYDYCKKHMSIGVLNLRHSIASCDIEN